MERAPQTTKSQSGGGKEGPFFRSPLFVIWFYKGCKIHISGYQQNKSFRVICLPAGT